MGIDFPESAARHSRDAEQLLENRRWGNADQLSGFCSECALKAVMRGLGMPTTSKGRPREKHHLVHVDKLWDEFFLLAEERGGGRYLEKLTADNPFQDWNVDQRYFRNRDVGPARARKHVEAAKGVMAVLEAAELDGVIR